MGRFGRWLRGLWRGSPTASKFLIVLAFAALLAYGAYKLFG